MASANQPQVARTGWAFFVLALGLTYAAQLPAALAHAGWLKASEDALLPLVPFGLFGPLLAALWFARSEPGGMRAVLRLRGRAPVSPLWFLLCLALPALLLGAGLLLLRAPAFYPPREPARLIALFIIPFVEEIGWRGYALPRLQARFGALVASVVLGVCWTVWHVPMFVLADVPLSLLPIISVQLTAASIVYTWLYNRTQGALWSAVLFHAGAHLNNSHAALPGDMLPLAIHAITLGAFASVLMMRRQLERQGPRTLRLA
jgi:membrane protease YdiL (CAAX protease family)